MELLPYIIWILLIVLLIAGALLWTWGGSLLPDPELRKIKDILCEVASGCGFDDSLLNIKRGKSFYTKDRKTIYLDLSKYKNKEEYVIRRSLHEVAHCLNRDASEHGGVFQQIEDKLLNKAKELNYLTIITDLKSGDCLTVLKEDDSEERAHHDRINYSMFFDPKSIY